jgi:hypothetical protein
VQNAKDISGPVERDLRHISQQQARESDSRTHGDTVSSGRLKQRPTDWRSSSSFFSRQTSVCKGARRLSVGEALLFHSAAASARWHRAQRVQIARYWWLWEWCSSTDFRNGAPPEEYAEFLQEHLPSWFLGKEKVIGARQRSIAGVGDLGGQLAAMLGRDHVVAIAMHNQRRHLHLSQESAYVDVGIDVDKSSSVFSRG